MTSPSTYGVLITTLGLVLVGFGSAQQIEEIPKREPPAATAADPNEYSPLRRSRAVESRPESTAPRSRYRTLLKQIEAPDDRSTYGDFCDFGYWTGSSYGGQSNLPPGYWVYLAPNWYIFKDEANGATPGTARPWGSEQATGAPDSWPRSGDLTTAWASQTQDGQREWLELTYEGSIKPVAVSIYETYNPGAVDRVTGYDAAGKEVELWSGADPTAPGQEKGISVVTVKAPFELSRIRIYLDSPKVAGWNEIDAVGLLDEAGTTHWAKSATASSTYADLSRLPGSGGVTKFWDAEELPRLRADQR